MIRFLPQNPNRGTGLIENGIIYKPRISAVFIFDKIFQQLFLKKRLTFSCFQFIGYGLSSWEPFNKTLNPWNSAVYGTNAKNGVPGKLRTLWIKAAHQNSRRDVQTVEFGISKLWLSHSAYPGQVVGLHINLVKNLSCELL